MRYELIYIIPAQVTEAELPAIQAKVKESLEAAGAKITTEKNVGRLKLAYPLKQSKYGYYFLAEFEAGPDALLKITNALRLSTDMARFQIAALKGESKPVEKLLSFEEAKMRAREERGARESKAPVVEPMIQEAAVKPAMSLEDLDKKLDQILNEPAS